MPPAINRNNDKAEERQKEGEVQSSQVNDACLKRRKEGAAEDGHDEAGGADLDVFASDALERHAVDCREHQRHARRHSDEAA